MILNHLSICYQYIKGITFSKLLDTKFSGLVSGMITKENQILS